MFLINPYRHLTTVLLGVSFLMLSCGKKTETIDIIPERVRPPISEIQRYVEKQNVTCEPNQACPHYISKIVVLHGNQFKFCTGFLTSDNVVATSTSCLPSILQLNGQDCSRDVFLFFPETAYRPAEQVGCVRVLQASHLEGQDPVLWRDDVSFLLLSTSMPYRRQATISRDGITDRKQFAVWMVEQQDDNSGVIKKSICESIHNNYINPLVRSDSSPNMLFGDCSVSNASSGAPVIDLRGRSPKVRGMVSKKMDPRLRNYLESTGLLFEGLKEMFHGTNFACAPTLDDNDMLDEAECLRSLTYTKVDRIRSEMLSTEVLFSELLKKLEDSLPQISKHVQFGVDLVSKGDVQEVSISPKCFKPLSSWIGTFGNRNTYMGDVKIPVRAFKKTMDSYGKVHGIAIEKADKKYSIQYSLKSLRSSGKSSILMWSGDEEIQTFSNLSEACPDLLF
jgi:hypothetical protein